MIYECPSCKVRTKDSEHPIDMVCTPLCVFCSSNHNQKELLNWQMNQIKNIPAEHFPLVLRHFYRYVESEINNLKDCFEREKNDRGAVS